MCIPQRSVVTTLENLPVKLKSQRKKTKFSKFILRGKINQIQFPPVSIDKPEIKNNRILS